jgi:hypothetical protein
VLLACYLCFLAVEVITLIDWTKRI